MHRQLLAAEGSRRENPFIRSDNYGKLKSYFASFIQLDCNQQVDCLSLQLYVKASH